MENEAKIGPIDSDQQKVWRLWREDIYGNQYRMPLEFNSQEQADEAQRLFTEKGHRQIYLLKQMDPADEITFIPGNDMYK